MVSYTVALKYIIFSLLNLTEKLYVCENFKQYEFVFINAFIVFTATKLHMIFA